MPDADTRSCLNIQHPIDGGAAKEPPPQSIYSVGGHELRRGHGFINCAAVNSVFAKNICAWCAHALESTRVRFQVSVFRFVAMDRWY